MTRSVAMLSDCDNDAARYARALNMAFSHFLFETSGWEARSKSGPSGEAWPLGGRRTQRPATFKELMVGSTKMKIEKIEPL